MPATTSGTDHRRVLRRIWFAFALVGVMLIVMSWATDFVTLEGEHTIYTVNCERQDWTEGNCRGRLVAAERLKFRAIKESGEVLFWTVGSPGPVMKLKGCVIGDRDNWSCAGSTDGSDSSAVMMVGGKLHSTSGSSLHPVSKIDWYLLRWGLSIAIHSPYEKSV